MHEKEHDEACLYKRDRKRDDDIERAEVLECDKRRQRRQQEQDAEDRKVGFARNNVLGHS